LALASYLDSNVGLYNARSVLELGAGGALPSIVAALNGARRVKFLLKSDLVPSFVL
jgi:nicotinamide N-methyltransferase